MYCLYVPKKCINQIVHMKVLEHVTNAHDSWFYVRCNPLGNDMVHPKLVVSSPCSLVPFVPNM